MAPVAAHSIALAHGAALVAEYASSAASTHTMANEMSMGGNVTNFSAVA